MGLDLEAFERTRRNAIDRLLSSRGEHGHWEGHLSSSALSTATAMVALSLFDQAQGRQDHRPWIEAAAQWLIAHQNEDGGWGDTDQSFSNIATTVLAWSALGHTPAASDPLQRAEAWLIENAGSLEPDDLTRAIHKRYGNDRTFSVPILMTAILGGRLGDPAKRSTWRRLIQLPFELAVLPQKLFRFVNMQVVSYALPALIAIGLLRHRKAPEWNPLARLIRNMGTGAALRRLQRIQPTTGGYLEATPLTSFVTMALVQSGLADHTVVAKAIEFLKRSARPDGSWPIDTNLATWVTTLSVNALAAGDRLVDHLPETDRKKLNQWLVDQQHTQIHPYTGAAPGGWAWTDLDGGVPDADDTAGAVAALWHLGERDRATQRAAELGIYWLRRLTNRDGGIPTFCRGWGRLPFDRSSTDITAHVLRAYNLWWDNLGKIDPDLRRVLDRSFDANYLSKTQHTDGYWLPLWFGNQHDPLESNPTYGTARVVMALPKDELRDRGLQWLLDNQNKDGGFGGMRGAPSSIEETALALEAMVHAGAKNHEAIEAALGWLITQTLEGKEFEPSPIGFYFAKLWYYEQLYPLIFTVGALEKASAWLQEKNSGPAVDPADGHD